MVYREKTDPDVDPSKSIYVYVDEEAPRKRVPALYCCCGRCTYSCCRRNHVDEKEKLIKVEVHYGR